MSDTCEWENVGPAKVCGASTEWRDKKGKAFCAKHGEHLISRFVGLTRVRPEGMHQHTFTYKDQTDFVQQIDDLIARLQEMEPYEKVRARYPHIKTAGAFSMRLKRFKGTFPKQMGPEGKRIIKLSVTRELHAHLL